MVKPEKNSVKTPEKKTKKKKKLVTSIMNGFYDDKYFSAVFNPKTRNMLLFSMKGGEQKHYLSYKIREDEEKEYFISPPTYLKDYVLNKNMFLPYKPACYESVDSLLQEIARFLDDNYEYPNLNYRDFDARWILATWDYDKFDGTGYRGCYGVSGHGKSRWALLVAMLAYYGWFAGTSVTKAGMSRLGNVIRGTMVIDENRFGGWNTEAAKDVLELWRGGFQRSNGYRTVMVKDRHGNYVSKRLQTFFPKIMCVEKQMDDEASVNRTVWHRSRKNKKFFSHELPENAYEEALNIRNKCFLWRLKRIAMPKQIDEEYDKMSDLNGRFIQKTLFIASSIQNSIPILKSIYEDDQQEVRFISNRDYIILSILFNVKDKRCLSCKNMADYVRKIMGIKEDFLYTPQRLGKDLREKFGWKTKRITCEKTKHPKGLIFHEIREDIKTWAKELGITRKYFDDEYKNLHSTEEEPTEAEQQELFLHEDES